jgi:cobalt-zinc-cadmium efflux system membrane fusion protein
MTSPGFGNRIWPAVIAGVVVAGGVGFGVARLTESKPAPAALAAEAASRAPGSLELPAEHIAAAGIVVAPVASGALSAEILAPAKIAAASKGQAIVTASAAGRVTRIAKQLGDPVRAGDVLAVVESREASAMAADRSVAEAKADQARKAAAREQQLFDQRVSPRQDLEAAQAELAVAEAEAKRARNASAAARVSDDGRSVMVVSPLAGRITVQTATLGAFVQPETELFQVADPKLVQAEAAVTAMDAARIVAGDPATIGTSAGTSLAATVRSVTPTLDPQTRSATVVLTFVAPPIRLSPGEAVEARITPKSGRPAGMVIPDEAVQSVGGRDVVFVRTPKGFIVQPIIVSSRSGGRAAIASGLAADQSIATRNAFLLKAQLGAGGGEEE